MFDPNTLVAAALILLGVTSLLLVGVVVPLLVQAGRTLLAYEKLADTIQSEISPTVGEVRALLGGLNTLKVAAARKATEVGVNVENAAESVGAAAAIATKRSSIWRAGLMAGLKAYFTGRGESC